jgi:hypothetical protein
MVAAPIVDYVLAATVFGWQTAALAHVVARTGAAIATTVVRAVIVAVVAAVAVIVVVAAVVALVATVLVVTAVLAAILGGRRADRAQIGGEYGGDDEFLVHVSSLVALQ